MDTFSAREGRKEDPAKGTAGKKQQGNGRKAVPLPLCLEQDYPDGLGPGVRAVRLPGYSTSSSSAS